MEKDADPTQVWDDFFESKQPHWAEIHNHFRKLLNSRRYQQTAVYLEAAIKHGRGQPWMYEVLPMVMELAGRPQGQIERAMLSRLDYTAVNIPSMLLSAAYLAGFKQEARALQLYRQASLLDPSRPEPYILGLPLAEKLDDVAAVQWATTGILTHVWTKDHRQLHRQADAAAHTLLERLRKAGDESRAAQFSQAVDQAKQRDLIVELSWEGNADLDMLVEEPPGTTCSFEIPRTSAGGFLVNDARGGNRSEKVETYVCSKGMAGTYRVKVRHVWGKVVARRAILKIIRYRGTERESIKTRTIQIGEQENVIRLTLKHGRRTRPARVNDTRQAARQPRERGSLLQMLAGAGGRVRVSGAKPQPRRPRGPNGQAAGVGFQPVIAIIPEGATLNVHSAVVSADRRYVRLSLTPVFSTLTDVFTFSFINSGGQNTGNPGVGGGGGGGPQN